MPAWEDSFTENGPRERAKQPHSMHFWGWPPEDSLLLNDPNPHCLSTPTISLPAPPLLTQEWTWAFALGSPSNLCCLPQSWRTDGASAESRFPISAP